MAVKTVDPQPLTQWQQLEIAFLTREDSDLWQAVRRVEYVRTDSRVKIRLGKEILKGAARGGSVGGIASVLIYLFNLSPPVPSPFYFFAKGVAIGAVAGGICGAAHGIKNHVIEIQQPDEYLRWRAEAIRDRILFSKFKDFVERADVAQGYCCMFTGDLLQIPVKAEDGRTYEKNRIEEWIRERTRVVAFHTLKIISREEFDGFKELPLERRKEILERIKGEASPDVLRGFSPLNTRYISEEGLKYDFDYHRNLFERLKRVFNREVHAQIREGLLKYQTDALTTRKQIAQALISQHAAEYAVKEISKKVFDQKVENIQRLVALELLG